MIQWTREELTRIGSADELQIAALRADGTIRTRVTTWVVPHRDNLYVRSVNGRGAAWFRGTQVTHEGRIWAAGIEKEVTFVDSDHDIDEELDAAYRDKYRRYARNIVNSILTPGARAATIKLLPR